MRDLLQALVDADPVIHVDHIVSDLQVSQVREEAGQLGFFLARPNGGKGAQDVVFTQQPYGQLRQNHALGKFGLEQADESTPVLFRTRLRGLFRLFLPQVRHLVLAKDFRQPVQLARRMSGEIYLPRCFSPAMEFFGQFLDLPVKFRRRLGVKRQLRGREVSCKDQFFQV